MLARLCSLPRNALYSFLPCEKRAVVFHADRCINLFTTLSTCPLEVYRNLSHHRPGGRVLGSGVNLASFMYHYSWWYNFYCNVRFSYEAHNIIPYCDFLCIFTALHCVIFQWMHSSDIHLLLHEYLCVVFMNACNHLWNQNSKNMLICPGVVSTLWCQLPTFLEASNWINKLVANCLVLRRMQWWCAHATLVSVRMRASSLTNELCNESQLQC